MNEAAVGFQCPECVRSGRKETRSGRTTYGGARSADASRTSYVIIGVNVAVWLAVLLTGYTSSHLIDVLGLRGDGLCEVGGRYFSVGQQLCDTRNGVWLPGVSDGALWQLVTSAFLHVQIWHLVGNMLGFYIIGPFVEQAVGRARFLAICAVSGLAGSTAVLLLTNPYQLTLGASGIVFGLFGAVAVLLWRSGGDLRGILTLLAINVFITFAVPNVSWQGHLGGFAGGLLAAAAIVLAPRGERRALVQWSLLAGLLVVVLVVAGLRVVALA
ncbi:MAG: rhomboid family intramembrane serine protease [Nocardioides sp.]|nr:rhomboid family intramembrane serine protease [Nocardioides sp.]